MNNGVQHKLIGYEATPPPGVWDKIAAELDESELNHVFPSKLYEAEVTAPAGTWNKIAAALTGENEVTAPERRTISPWLRYAAAAVLLGFIAWGGVQLLNNKKSNNSVASSETSQPQERNSDIGTVLANPDEIKEQPEVNSDIADDARNDAALEASKKTYAKLEAPAYSNKLKNIASAYHFASGSDMTEPDNYVMERDPDNLNNRYIVMMTPDGHFVRMAKKLSNMVCCVSGEEQNKDCIDQMSRWKEKMACSPTGHSTGSFLDILSLIKSLDEQ